MVAVEARAVARHVRISPRKARQVVDLIRGKDLQEALAILELTPKAASKIVSKVVRSAAANAENNHEMDPDSLCVPKASVDQGPAQAHPAALPGPRGAGHEADQPYH